MRKEFREGAFVKMKKILEGNGYVCSRTGTSCFVYRKGAEVIMLPRNLCEKDFRSMKRRYGLM